MKYLKVKWVNASPDQPRLIYSEIDNDGWEVRKIEEYPDGKCGYADLELEVGGSFLSTEPLPSFDEIATQPEFHPEIVTQDEFEGRWREAKRNPR